MTPTMRPTEPSFAFGSRVRWSLTFATKTMNDIHLASTNMHSGLQCLISSDNGAVWVYLRDPSAQSRVIGDAPLCTQTPPITLTAFNERYTRGETPPLVVEYSTRRAVKSDLGAEHISIRWSEDGKSVAALIDDEPFAMILSGEKMGYSKAIAKSGPWGKPWNDDLFATGIGEPCVPPNTHSPSAQGVGGR